MNARAACNEVNRSGNTGAYFNVLFHASEKGLSLDTRGREWDRVTSRSSSSIATDLLVIDVPRSADNTPTSPPAAVWSMSVTCSWPPAQLIRGGGAELSEGRAQRPVRPVGRAVRRCG